MLRELHISNLAIIEDAAVSFDPGLNVFTGETGAGKSLIIGAFEILLGLRTAGDMVRPDTDEGRVSGVFELHDAETADAIGQVDDQSLEAGEQLLITRKLFASGRSSVSVNGQPATTPMVKQVGQRLVDIHGQHDHQYLLKPAHQVLILDDFAGCADQRQRFAETLRKLRELRQQQEELAASRNLRRQQLELYEFQADEIDRIDPQPGELPELQARYQVLSNLQRIKRDAGSAHSAMYEAEGSVVERLQIIVHLLGDLAELDESLDNVRQQVYDATASLEEAAFELNRYVDRLDDDPSELAEVDDRLNELNRLVQKYAHETGTATSDDAIEPVLAYREQIGSEIERLRGEDKGLAGMDREIAALRRELRTIGESLSKARQAAAKKLRPLVEAQLKELGMSEARFEVQFEALDPEDEDALPASGLDQIEMIVQTNPGQKMQPLRKIASGGEMSRIMLALKSILAGSDRISVIVFDEIDANVGGRLGSVIGLKLRDLAHGLTPANNGAPKRTRTRNTSPNRQITKSPNHQVLCITHLPQIAAYADQHLRITKQIVGQGKSRQTRTSVAPLTGTERIEDSPR
ncbi:MAG: DNA repair protein RecN [Phycisphaeraceae bacterium]